MTSAKTPAGTNGLITSHGMVSDNEFVDPISDQIFIFDHIQRKFTGSSEKKVEASEFDELRKAVQNSMDTYLGDKYVKDKATCVVYATKKGIVICVHASNTKISSFWTGGWNSVYVLDTTAEAVELAG